MSQTMWHHPRVAVRTARVRWKFADATLHGAEETSSPTQEVEAGVVHVPAPRGIIPEVPSIVNRGKRDQAGILSLDRPIRVCRELLARRTDLVAAIPAADVGADRAR